MKRRITIVCAAAVIGYFIFDILNDYDRVNLLKSLDYENDPILLYRLGVISDGVFEKEKQIEYYTRAAELGNAAALCKMAHMYEHGISVPKDEQKAYDYYLRSAYLLYPESMYMVANANCYGNLGQPENIDNAIKWYKSALRFQIPSAAIQLGRIYVGGKGVEKNIPLGYAYVYLAKYYGYIPAEDFLGDKSWLRPEDMPKMKECFGKIIYELYGVDSPNDIEEFLRKMKKISHYTGIAGSHWVLPEH